MVGALYTALSLLTLPVSSGAVQFRVSESLTLLPLVFPETAVGVFVGCALSNLITGCAPWDVVLGSLVTLLSLLITLAVGKWIRKTPFKIILGGLPHVLFNAICLPLIWLYCYGGLEYAYAVQALLIFIGQALSVYAVGVPLYLSVLSLKNKGLFR